MDARCTGLTLFPIKGAAGVNLNEAVLTPRGLAVESEGALLADRSCAVWNPGAAMIRSQDRSARDVLTQREYPAMALLESTFERGRIILSMRDMRMEPFEITPDHIRAARSVDTKVWGARTPGLDCGDEVALWLGSAIIGNKDSSVLRFVKFGEEGLRERVSRFMTKAGAVPRFADGFPFHTVSENALDDLNDRIRRRYSGTEYDGLSLDGASFRPNIRFRYPENILDDDVMNLATVSGLALEHTKPCTRCSVTTIEQQGGIRLPSGEPLKTLAKYRLLEIRPDETVRWEREIAFGWNAELRSDGSGETSTIAVGDNLRVELRTRQDPRWRVLPESG